MKLKKYDEKIKYVIITVLLLFSSILNYLFQIIFKIDVVFTHFFYIPTVLACFWWKKIGLFIPIFLVISQILLPFIFGININSLQIIEKVLRALLLIVFGIIVSTLSENISDTKELTTAYNDTIFYRDLISHDMNNIFQNILSSTELYSILKKNGKNDNEIEELFKIIRDQCFRGIQLATNVQKLAKLEEPQFYLKKINVKKVLQDSTMSIKTTFQEREIIFSIKAPEKIVWVKANELLSEVFTNLLINAVKYNDNPIVKISIKISTEQYNKNNYLKIEIKDNGIGIPNKRKEIIFEKRVNKDKYSKGMGFGLSLVKGIIYKYNGQIWVQDRVAGDYSKGSNFIFLIPQFIK